MIIPKVTLPNGAVLYNADTEEHSDMLVGVDILAIELEELKTQKKANIKEEKKARQLLPVEVRGVLFNGGREAGQKYDEAFRLAKMLGLTVGNFADVTGTMIEVDEGYATEVVVAVAGASYNLWAKEQSYKAEIDSATTIAEVESIVWVDA